jgi:uncharacterized protein
MPLSARIFVDANVLFSASYQADHHFLFFWTSSKVRIVTSSYVINETRRNIFSESHLYRLNQLLAQTEIISHDEDDLPQKVSLPEKDRPILAAAIAARASYLVTGDKKHFGKYFYQTLETPSGPLTVIEPAPLLQLLKRAQ